MALSFFAESTLWAFGDKMFLQEQVVITVQTIRMCHDT